MDCVKQKTRRVVIPNIVVFREVFVKRMKWKLARFLVILL